MHTHGKADDDDDNDDDDADPGVEWTLHARGHMCLERGLKYMYAGRAYVLGMDSITQIA